MEEKEGLTELLRAYQSELEKVRDRKEYYRNYYKEHKEYYQNYHKERRERKEGE